MTDAPLLNDNRRFAITVAILVLCGLIVAVVAGLAMQKALAAKGYDVGKVDGLPGYKTRRSLGDWQAKSGLAATCFPDASLKTKLR